MSGAAMGAKFGMKRSYTLQSPRKERSSVKVVGTLNPWMASVFLFATSSRPGLIVWPK